MENKKIIIKSIPYLEQSNIETEKPGGKTRQVDYHITDGAVNQPINLQVTQYATQVSILKKIRIPLAYLAGLTLAESLTTLANPKIGLILHGIILITLILHSTLFSRRSEQKFLITLTLAPLIRLMSLSVPLLSFPTIYWYAVIGAPLLLAAYLVLRITGFKASNIGLNGRAMPWQIVIGLSGLVFGYVEYKILRPAPLIEALSWQQIWLPALILLIFTGFLEEIIFRGIIQRGAAGTLGRYGIFYVSAIFAVLHIGYKSILDVVFVFLVALFFGYLVSRTGSLIGVTISHGMTNIALYLIIPFLMNGSSNPVAEIRQIEIDMPPIHLARYLSDSNSRLIIMENPDSGTSDNNPGGELQDIKVIEKLNGSLIKDPEARSTEKWEAEYSDNKTYRATDTLGQIGFYTSDANSKLFHLAIE